MRAASLDALPAPSVSSAPGESVRVLAARLDILTPAEERRAEEPARALEARL